MNFFKDHAVLFALVCAGVGIAYGIGLTIWLLRQPAGSERMREISRIRSLPVGLRSSQIVSPMPYATPTPAQTSANSTAWSLKKFTPLPFLRYKVVIKPARCGRLLDHKACGSLTHPPGC